MSTKDDIFNYVMNSPEDTNPAVLKSLLNGIEEGGSGGGDIYYVNFHQVKEEPWDTDAWECDKEQYEIFTALNEGKRVIGKIYFYGNDTKWEDVMIPCMGKWSYPGYNNELRANFVWLGNFGDGYLTLNLLAMTDDSYSLIRYKSVDLSC